MRHQTEPVDTDRLRLLPWSDDDLEPFAALCADSRAMSFISRGRPRRVMEKAGLAFRDEIDWRSTRVVWYAVDRPGAR